MGKKFNTTSHAAAFRCRKKIHKVQVSDKTTQTSRKTSNIARSC